MWVKQAHLESLAPAAGSPQKPAAGSPTDATLAKYRAKLEDRLAAKLAMYDKDAAVRAKENAKHGNARATTSTCAGCATRSTTPRSTRR